MHGKGCYSWQDGKMCEGEFEYDKKHVKCFGDLKYYRCLEFMFGRMEGGMMGSGEMENSMEKENMFQKMVSRI